MPSTYNDSGQLKSALLALIGEHLGSFSNGLAAIWVEPPLLPESTKVTGLKCVIQLTPTGNVKVVSPGARHLERVWTVFLVNFDRDTEDGAHHFLDAKALIERKFVHYRPPVYLPPTSTTYEQARFSIYSPTMVSGV